MKIDTKYENFGKTSNDAFLRTLAIVLIMLGLCFRFNFLDQKVYWADEAFTSLRISGYRVEEVAQAVYNQPAISVEAFQKYQHLSPENNVADTVNGLITEEPQLTPLYFVLVHIWSQMFGTSIAAIRCFSAILGSFAVIGMYWLCLELLESQLAGWVGAALIAVSPFHLIYAQEARPYSLMTVSVILSSYFFLRALRKSTRLSWGIYSITIILGFYSHLLTALAILAHGLYLLVLRRLHKKKYLLNYGLSLTVALLAFTPWILALLTNRHQAQAMTNWASEKISSFALLRVWLGNISRLVVDFGFSSSLTSENTGLTVAFLTFSVLFLLFLSAYSLYYLYQRTHPKVGLFVISLIGVTFLIVWLPDLLLGSKQSTAPRYSIALFLGIQLAITHLFTSKIVKIRSDLKRNNSSKPAGSFQNPIQEENSAKKFPKVFKLSRGGNLWSLLIVATFAFSIGSCIASQTAQVWWHQAPQYTRHLPEAAAIINRLNSPLIIVIPQVDGDLMRVESLAHLLRPDVKLQFFRQDENVFDIATDEPNTLIYFPFVDSQEAIEKFQERLEIMGERSLEPFPNTDNMLFKLR